MNNKQSNSQKVKVQAQQPEIEQNSSQIRQNKAKKKEQEKIEKKKLQKLKRAQKAKKKRLIQKRLCNIIGEGKSIEQAVQLMKNRISLEQAKNFMARLKKNKLLKARYTLRKDIVQHEKCKEMMEIKEFNNFESGMVNLFHLVRQKKIKKEDVKSQMGIFLAGELVRLRMAKMEPGSLQELVGPIFMAFQFPALQMPKFLEPPRKYSQPKKEEAEAKLQE